MKEVDKLLRSDAGKTEVIPVDISGIDASIDKLIENEAEGN